MKKILEEPLQHFEAYISSSSTRSSSEKLAKDCQTLEHILLNLPVRRYFTTRADGSDKLPNPWISVYKAFVELVISTSEDPETNYVME